MRSGLAPRPRHSHRRSGPGARGEPEGSRRWPRAARPSTGSHSNRPEQEPESKQMPAEQTLTGARGQSGPSSGPGDGASRASRPRLDQTAALIAPVALIVGLALAGGGFDVSGRHIAGLAVWLVVVGLLVLGAASSATLGRPLYWAGGLIGGLALLSAISSLWSGSIELSVIEADRVLVYLSFFLAAFLIAQTDERRQRFAEGLVIAVTLVALLGLGSRLLPHVLNVGDSLGTGARLRYPLGYWNANGAMCGIGDRAAAVDEPPRRLDDPALALGRRDAGSPAHPLLHLLARRPARPHRRHRLPDRPLPRPPLAAGDAGDRRPRSAACDSGRTGARQPRRTTSPTRQRSPRGDSAADTAHRYGRRPAGLRSAWAPREERWPADRQGAFPVEKPDLY